jgi:hypothetical protein
MLGKVTADGGDVRRGFSKVKVISVGEVKLSGSWKVVDKKVVKKGRNLAALRNDMCTVKMWLLGRDR